LLGRAVPRNEQQRAERRRLSRAAQAAGLFSISAARRQEATSSSRWLKARCSKTTTPESWRDWLSRFPTTVVAARSVSPIRTGFGKRTSSQPMFPSVVPEAAKSSNAQAHNPKERCSYPQRIESAGGARL